MEKEMGIKGTSLISEIRQKFRYLNTMAAAITAALLAVIIYLYISAGRDTGFLSNASIPLLIIMALAISLAAAGFYIARLLSMQIITGIAGYSSRLDHILNTITKDVRDEIYGDILLNKIMDYSLSITNSDAGSVLLLEGDKLVFKIIKGEKTDILTNTAIPKDKGIAGWVVKNCRPLRIADTTADERFYPDIDNMTGYQTKSLLCVPLVTKEGTAGVIELLNKKDGFYTERDEEILTYIADQAAISLARAKFYEDQKNYEIHLTNILLQAMDNQLPERAGHSRRTARLSNIMAGALALPERKKKRLHLASLLHDIGFLKINADNTFQPENFIRHPVIGYELISQINFYADIAPFILYHHERYDGKGYPAALNGEAIPVESRIIAIAEAFDSMMSGVSYKVPVNFNLAVGELRRCAGTQFDPELVEVFIKNLRLEQIQKFADQA